MAVMMVPGMSGLHVLLHLCKGLLRTGEITRLKGLAKRAKC
jgi:hypothetical protein